MVTTDATPTADHSAFPMVKMVFVVTGKPGKGATCQATSSSCWRATRDSVKSSRSWTYRGMRVQIYTLAVGQGRMTVITHGREAIVVDTHIPGVTVHGVDLRWPHILCLEGRQAQ